MRAKINGEYIEFVNDVNLLDFIQKDKKLNPKSIVIEYNGKVLKKEEWQNTFIKDGDIIEIVHFVGGG
ncbi:MAG: sulfur carrier protein ThiS [Brevinematales bacterium]|nr:sulfur carrier protein ThiS [Brevinematales bacterium]